MKKNPVCFSINFNLKKYQHQNYVLGIVFRREHSKFIPYLQTKFLKYISSDQKFQ